MPVELTTPNNAFRYPTSANNGSDFATGVADHATDVDAMWAQGTLAGRPAASKRGRVYYATDTGLYYTDTGSSWLTLLQLGLGSLAIRSTTVGITANAGDLVQGNGTFTVTLPQITQDNMLVGVTNIGGGLLTIAAGAAQFIQGVGLSGAASFTLGTLYSTVVLQGHASNGSWYFVGGQRDTGWVALALNTGVSATGGSLTPGVRLQGDTVRLKGNLTSTGSQTFLATPLSSIFRPTQNLQVAALNQGSSAQQVLNIGSDGSLAGGLGGLGGTVPLDGISYVLV